MLSGTQGWLADYFGRRVLSTQKRMSCGTFDRALTSAARGFTLQMEYNYVNPLGGAHVSVPTMSSTDTGHFHSNPSSPQKQFRPRVCRVQGLHASKEEEEDVRRTSTTPPGNYWTSDDGAG